jgi:glycosyltransferase involved in cell wall biosynthesis
MNVLHFAPVYKPAWRYGGPVRSVSQLCEGLAALGVQVTVATTNANGHDRLPVATNTAHWMDGVAVYHFAQTATPGYIESLSLRRHLDRLVAQADLVHLSAVWQPLGLAVASAARKAHKPYICSLRGCVNPWIWKTHTVKHKIYWRLFEFPLLAGAAALHATCASEREDALALGVGRQQKFYVVPNCLDTHAYAHNPPLRQRFRDSLGLSAAQKLILYLGRIHPQKGIDLFLDAAAEVLRSSPQWLYVIAGPSGGGYSGYLAQKIRRLGLENQVRIMDLLQDDMRLGALSAADVLALTSTSENFGMSIVEAMAASVPVLVSDRVGIAHEIQEDQAGLVVPLEPGAVRAAIGELVANEEMRRFYGENGCKSAQARFAAAAVAAQMQEMYSGILAHDA